MIKFALHYTKIKAVCFTNRNKKMNLSEYSISIKQVSKNITDNLDTYVKLPAVITGAALVVQRFSEGFDVNGNKIGDYSTKKLYASKDMFEGHDSYFKPEKGRKTMTFDDGYAGLRRYVKLQANTVDLVYSTSLAKSVQGVLYGKDAAIAILGKDSVDKSIGNEKRFNKTIFDVSESEIDAMNQVIDNAISDLWNF